MKYVVRNNLTQTSIELCPILPCSISYICLQPYLHTLQEQTYCRSSCKSQPACDKVLTYREVPDPTILLLASSKVFPNWE